MSGSHAKIRKLYGHLVNDKENWRIISQVSFWAHSPAEMSLEQKKKLIKKKKAKEKSYYRKNRVNQGRKHQI